MSEVVRIAIYGSENGKINWPNRCPHCGTTGDLINVNGRVVRESVGNLAILVGVLTFRRETTNIGFLVCRKHASQCELANRLLERSSIFGLVRVAIYLGLAFCLMLLSSLLTHTTTLASVIERGGFGPILFSGFGVLGIFVLWWARSNASVRLLSIDSGTDVVSIRFHDKKYARDFKRANVKATHRYLTEAPSFWMRPGFWKLVLVILVFAIVFKMSNQP